MSNVIEFKSKQNLIDEKHKQIEKDLADADAAFAEWEAIANSGKKPTIEETKALWSRMLKPDKSLSELHKLSTGEERKSILESAAEMTLNDFSKGELKSGFLTIDHVDEFENLSEER